MNKHMLQVLLLWVRVWRPLGCKRRSTRAAWCTCPLPARPALSLPTALPRPSSDSPWQWTSKQLRGAPPGCLFLSFLPCGLAASYLEPFVSVTHPGSRSPLCAVNEVLGYSFPSLSWTLTDDRIPESLNVTSRSSRKRRNSGNVSWINEHGWQCLALLKAFRHLTHFHPHVPFRSQPEGVSHLPLASKFSNTCVCFSFK